MFVKAFKTRSNIQLKGSDRKKLKSRIASQFSKLTDEQLNILISNKSTCCAIKAVTHNETSIIIYTVDKKPLFFEVEHEQRLIPSVYALWLVPDAVYVFTTYPDVLPKLANGADLMLPGVIRECNDLRSWGRMNKGDVVAVNLSTNRAVIAVGRLAHSSHDLYMCGGRGICVEVMHVFGDKLWGMEPSVCEQPPLMGATVTVPTMDDFPALGSEEKEKTVPPTVEEQVAEIKIEEEAAVVEETTPDTILKRAFLSALKLNGKNIQLPLLTSTFYPQYVQPALSEPIDVKKTSFKKVGAFLKAMSAEGFIVIKEENKGVEKIFQINLEHPELVGFRPQKPEKVETEKDGPKPQLLLNKMTEIYVVNDATARLFTNFNLPPGSKLEEKEVKDRVKDYIGRNSLLDRTIQKVNINPLLAEICGREGQITVEELVSLVRSRMDTTFEMRTQDRPASKAGKKPVIQMTTATRSGNKKVTLISNLEAYGINIPEFAKAIKLGVAASTTMTEVPGQKCEQLLVQGNQVRFIHNLLTGTYKIPRGCITGLEFATKEKKKK